MIDNNISELKKFIIDNNIVGTSAGVCVALAAKDGIQSLVGDVIIPAIVIVLRMLHIDVLTKYLPVKGNSHLKIADFIKQMVTFVLIIIISFIFVKFAFGYLLGVNYTKSGSPPSSGANSNTITTAAALEKSNK
jgi:large-conductance mechanosensitive channel